MNEVYHSLYSCTPLFFLLIDAVIVYRHVRDEKQQQQPPTDRPQIIPTSMISSYLKANHLVYSRSCMICTICMI